MQKQKKLLNTKLCGFAQTQQNCSTNKLPNYIKDSKRECIYSIIQIVNKVKVYNL